MIGKGTGSIAKSRKRSLGYPSKVAQSAPSPPSGDLSHSILPADSSLISSGFHSLLFHPALVARVSIVLLRRFQVTLFLCFHYSSQKNLSRTYILPNAGRSFYSTVRGCPRCLWACRCDPARGDVADLGWFEPTLPAPTWFVVPAPAR